MFGWIIVNWIEYACCVTLIICPAVRNSNEKWSSRMCNCRELLSVMLSTSWNSICSKHLIEMSFVSFGEQAAVYNVIEWIRSFYMFKRKVNCSIWIGGKDYWRATRRATDAADIFIYATPKCIDCDAKIRHSNDVKCRRHVFFIRGSKKNNNNKSDKIFVAPSTGYNITHYLT